ncbi:MAG: extracellular solute-binding protein, partial [Firmicutes bacterium]|nr:extracellular solute-binding protein [Bacillota bacterium]
EQIPWTAYREKMLTDFAAGQGADIVEISSYWMCEFVGRKLLLALDEYMATDPDLAKDKWIPGAFLERIHTFAGATYGLPSGDSPKVLWFNKDVFAAAGVKNPLEWEAEGKWNWDTFLDVVTSLTKGEGPSKHFGYWTWMARADTHDIMRSFGGGWTDQDASEVWCEKPESIQGLQFALDIFLKHKAAPLTQELQAMGGGQQMFLTGRLAMFMSGVWEVYSLKQTKVPYDVAPLPSGPAGRFMHHGANALVLPAACKHPDQAWELMRFLKSPGLEKIMVQGEGFMPFQKASVETFLSKGHIPSAQVFIDALEKGWAPPIPLNTNATQMDQVVGDALGIALSEGKDAAWVAAEVAPKLEPLVG